MSAPSAYPGEFYPGQVYPGQHDLQDAYDSYAKLNESEWMINGVRFGTIESSGLYIAEMEFGEFTIDTGDINDPYGKGILPGLDLWRGATISFTVGTAFTTNEVDAFEEIRPLINEWAKGANLKARETVPLRFCAGGRQLVVYGRPRRFTQPIPDIRSKRGKVTVALDFIVTDPAIYAVSDDGSTSQSETFRLIAPNEEGGVIWHEDGGADIPFWWDGEVSGEVKGGVGNASPNPVPFTVRIRGPVSNPSIRGGSWAIELTGRGGLTVPYDRAVVIDTRTGTARWEDNAQPVAAYLSRASRLNARLAPGGTIVTVSGVDPTGTSTFTLSWSTATPTA